MTPQRSSTKIQKVQNWQLGSVHAVVCLWCLVVTLLPIYCSLTGHFRDVWRSARFTFHQSALDLWWGGCLWGGVVTVHLLLQGVRGID